VSDWHAEARALREADPSLTYEEIARRFGVAKSAAWRAVNPQRAAAVSARSRASTRDQRRAYDRVRWAASRTGCPHCGALKDPMSAMCMGCFLATATVRQSLAEGMWADGWPVRDMAAAFGVSKGYFTARRAMHGWDLPLRQKTRSAAA
jgi:hypothetical protein